MVINEEREVPPNSDFTPFILGLFLRRKLMPSVEAFNMVDRNPTYTFQNQDAFEHHFFFSLCCFYLYVKQNTCEEIKTRGFSTVSLNFW